MISQMLTRARELSAIIKDYGAARRRLDTLAFIASETYRRELLSGARYKERLIGTLNEPVRLEPYGYKIYSQFDEDGIIQEIFGRIGHGTSVTGSRYFVEFGVEDGLECNTLALLLLGWKGLWIEADHNYVNRILAKFADVIADGRLTVAEAFVDRDNINRVIAEHGFGGNVDLLSIDIDGNDLRVFEAITRIRPRVVVIEYNGKFPPPINLVPRYDPKFKWRGCDYNGSSLEAIAVVAERKGYKLVGCSLAGVNAFLVREDLVNSDKFAAPFTAKNHYQPMRSFLWQTFPSGHHPDWGPYERA